MSIKEKKAILLAYYRKLGKMPEGTLEIDADTDTVGNVYIDGNFAGTFDFCEMKFIS